MAAGQPRALAKHDPAEPRREGPRLTEVGQLAVGREEGLLGSILSQVKIAEYSISTAVGHVLKTLHNLAERFESSGSRKAAVSRSDY